MTSWWRRQTTANSSSCSRSGWMSLKEEKLLSSSIFSSSYQNLPTHKTNPQILSMLPSPVNRRVKGYLLISFRSTVFHFYSSSFFFFDRGSQDKQPAFCVLFVTVRKVPPYPCYGFIWLHGFMEKKRRCKASDERIAQSPLNKLSSNEKIQGLFFFLPPPHTPLLSRKQQTASVWESSGRGFYVISCEDEGYLQVFEGGLITLKDHGHCFLLLHKVAKKKEVKLEGKYLVGMILEIIYLP